MQVEGERLRKYSLIKILKLKSIWLKVFVEKNNRQESYGFRKGT